MSPSILKPDTTNSYLNNSVVKAITDHYHNFCDFISQAEHFLKIGEIDAAAVFGQMAADYAFRNHPGFFVSPRLENLLTHIGRMTMERGAKFSDHFRANNSPKRILHILTQAYELGGHTRLAWRWIERDKDHIHSVLLTRQGERKVPKNLINAVKASGGHIYRIDKQFGGLISRAKTLRRLANQNDIVVLHIHPYDVVPIIGLSYREKYPAVCYMNHADHLFWLGVSISDVIAHIRQSSWQLSIKRRKVEAKRCLMLPIPVNKTNRQLTRVVAKFQLGIAEDAIVLLSVASGYKYNKIDDKIHFINAVRPILEKCDKTILLVVGPSESDLHLDMSLKVYNRIKVYGPQKDIELFYQAADIYLDSFPFASITSLLEAGSFGVPIVSYCVHPEQAAVLCADDPGLIKSLVCTKDLESYRNIIIKLIQDDSLRDRLGKQTENEIVEVHEILWPQFLKSLYETVWLIEPPGNVIDDVDEVHADEIDTRLVTLQKATGKAWSKEMSVWNYYRLLPLWLRYQMRNQRHRKFPRWVPDWLISESLGKWLKKISSTVYFGRVVPI